MGYMNHQKTCTMLSNIANMVQKPVSVAKVVL
jgi:hypothetical protein